MRRALFVTNFVQSKSQSFVPHSPDSRAPIESAPPFARTDRCVDAQSFGATFDATRRDARRDAGALAFTFRPLLG